MASQHQQGFHQQAHSTNYAEHAYIVLMVSRVVWDHVVSPGWLDDAPGAIKASAPGRRHADAFRAAEAMFPIVGLVCRRALALAPPGARWGACVGSYGAIASAASVPAPSCVAWLVNRRRHTIYVGGRPSRNMDRNNQRASSSPSASYEDAGGGGCGEVGVGVDVDVVVKEVSATVMGLLVGGHVGLATSMFGGSRNLGGVEAGSLRCNNSSSGGGGGRCTLPRLWDGRRVLGWETACRRTENGAGDSAGTGDDNGDCGSDGGAAVEPSRSEVGCSRLREKVIENVRAECGSSKFAQTVCLTGSVDVVKWFVDVFGIGVKEAPWIMYERIRDLPPITFSLTYSLVPNKHSTVEDCKLSCVEEYLCGNGYEYILEDVHNPDVVKWLLTTFLAHDPDADEVNCICKSTGDVNLVEWLVTEHHFTPTAATFAAACSTSRKKGSTLAKWLSTRVSLSQSEITKSLVYALNSRNIEVSEWLAASFHVMEAVNSSTEVAENCLVDLCRGYGVYEDRVKGLEWFLQHLSSSQASKIRMTCIHEAISHSLEISGVNCVAVLLEMFPAFEPHRDQTQFEKIVIEFLMCGLKAFQWLCSRPCSATFTPEFVGNCLTSMSFHPLSSKLVKWVICEFNVQYTQIKANNNLLLFRLLKRQMNRCAQWLIDSFDIPLDDVVAIAQLASGTFDSIDLAGWHMILNHYGPTIDATLIRKHLMPLVSRSPHVAIHAINSFGLTIHEFRDYVVTQAATTRSSTTVKLWLGLPID
ncbi:hypothetical protein Pelo_17316 [Pelomyxa schiedti]|nr:hypothetical protein Pelo_17316 [Pelomyxa schiedti]